MPLFSIYSLALEQDQEQSVGLQMANTTLHNQTFIQVNGAALLLQRGWNSTPDLLVLDARAASGSAPQGARKEAQGDQRALDSRKEEAGKPRLTPAAGGFEES